MCAGDLNSGNKTIVLYGAGEYYVRNRRDILEKVRPDLICDRRLSEEGREEMDGIRVVSFAELSELDAPFILLAIEKWWLIEELGRALDAAGLPHRHVSELLGRPVIRSLSGRFLKENHPEGMYEDETGNHIRFDVSIPEKLCIDIVGENNEIRIGKNISVGGRLWVRCGSNSILDLGDNTEIWDAEVVVSGSTIRIGRDCLFSRRIELRAHDSHQIFSSKTGERLNYAKDIIVGDQVWVSEDVILLGGAKIGTGSVVGTGCVTSAEFEDHVVIIGAPGRVLHKDIYWSRDDIEYLGHDRFADCIDQRALQYV